MSELPVVHAPAGHGVVPVEADADSRVFWAGLDAGELRLPRCEACGRAWFPPGPRCQHCGATTWSTVVASGHGRLYSWVTVHRALDPAFAEDVPYTVGVVTLDEGPRLVGRLLDVADTTPRIELPMRAVVYDLDAQRLLGFVPRREDSSDEGLAFPSDTAHRGQAR